MISFKQFLVESRSAPLYHGTSLRSLGNIIMTKGIKSRTEQKAYKLLKPSSGEWINGVSASRSFVFAKQWGDEECVIELDQAALSRNYQIKP